MGDTIKRVTREQAAVDEIPEGYEVLRLIFGKQGPIILLSDAGEQMLRGPNSEKMRTFIDDAIKAVLDKITVH